MKPNKACLHIRIARITKTIISSGEEMKKIGPSYCWWQCKMMQLLCETVGHFLNLQHRITTWPSDSTSSYRHQGSKAGTQKDTCTAMYTATSFTTTKKWKQGKCPSVGEQISKVWYTHRMEYYSAFKGDSDTCYNMDGTWRHYAK